jgi:hypothetical protein
MADLEIRISAKDMGAGAALAELKQEAGKAEGALERAGRRRGARVTEGP